MDEKAMELIVKLVRSGKYSITFSNNWQTWEPEFIVTMRALGTGVIAERRFTYTDSDEIDEAYNREMGFIMMPSINDNESVYTSILSLKEELDMKINSIRYLI